MEPPIIVILRLRATSDSIAIEGEASPPNSISSAYTGKLSFEYGQFHVSCDNDMQSKILQSKIQGRRTLVFSFSFSVPGWASKDRKEHISPLSYNCSMKTTQLDPRVLN